MNGLPRAAVWLGGPHDGELFDATGYGNMIQVAEPRPWDDIWADDGADTSPTFYTTTYRLMRGSNGAWYAVHPSVAAAVIAGKL